MDFQPMYSINETSQQLIQISFKYYNKDIHLELKRTECNIRCIFLLLSTLFFYKLKKKLLARINTILGYLDYNLF